jgi:hypothetical protein
LKKCILGFCFVVFAQVAGAYEYPLQFTPNPGYLDLVVAGYYYSGSTVVGNCSYYTQHGGSGKGGGYHVTTTYYNQTCTWDLYGNLLSVAQGEPAIPAPLYDNGSESVYAVTGNGEYTGTDTKLPFGGFVFTQGSHYTWLTSNAYMDLPQKPYTFAATLVSDGDVPLNISKVAVSAVTIHHPALNSTTCVGEIPVGSTCGITVTYNPWWLSSPTGLAYDTLTIAVTSDAGEAYNFVQRYTISVRVPTDTGGN